MAYGKVTVIQRILPHYRIRFFDELQGKLRNDGIELHIVYGQEYPGTVPRTMPCNEPWAHRIENRYYRIAAKEVVWQPCIGGVKDSSLIILEHSSRLLLNYLFLTRLAARNSRLAFWGHGTNIQTGMSSRLHERLKGLLSAKVDWWFAYTDPGAKLVAGIGFPSGKITVVHNSIDTRELKRSLEQCSPETVDAVRSGIGITGENICLYCGGMYEFKMLGFLLRACMKIRERIPDFCIIFIGDGPDRKLVESAAAQHGWIYSVGPKFGSALAPFYKLGKAFLMPGSVGLAIVDSFVAGVPLFTTDIPGHGPEIAYLENGVNGVMTARSEEAYADAVAGYLQNEISLNRLRQGCERSGARYSIEAMAENFAEGIKRCLAAP